MEKHLHFLLKASGIYLTVLTGEQNSLKRFLYCCAEKLNKSAIVLQYLYPLTSQQRDVEFSMGIILRSLLMDSLLTQYLRYFTLEVTEENYDQTILILQKESLRLIADGTAQIVADFFHTDKLTAEQKKQIANKIAGIFPGLFASDSKTGMPKLLKEYRVNISDLHEKGKHQNQHSKQTVYDLYAFYSKYDHVSHWTSILGNISWDERLHKLHSSIVMILFNLRDLLVIGQFLPDIRTSIPGLLTMLDNHMNDLYKQGITS